MQPSPRGHHNNFNLLRLLGAVLVMFSHMYYVAEKGVAEPLNLLTNGRLEASGVGLSIFFFISGYFVTKSAAESKTFFLFVKKRVLRIYPALIVLVLFSVFIAGPLLTILPAKAYFSDKNTWMYLFTATGLRIRMNLPGVFSQDTFFNKSFNASLWTIGLEIKLYLSVSFFLLVGILKNKKLFGYVSMIIILACFSMIGFARGLSFEWKAHLNLVSIFYLGSFIYSTALKEKYITRILLSSVILYIIFNQLQLPGFNPIFLLLMALSLCIYFIGFTKKLTISITTDISYGLYIYAFPVQQIIFSLSTPGQPVMLLLIESLAVVVPLALLSWYLVEKPCLGLKYKTGMTEQFFNKFGQK